MISNALPKWGHLLSSHVRMEGPGPRDEGGVKGLHRGVWGLAKANQFVFSPFFPAVSPQVWGEDLPAVGCGVPW